MEQSYTDKELAALQYDCLYSQIHSLAHEFNGTAKLKSLSIQCVFPDVRQADRFIGALDRPGFQDVSFGRYETNGNTVYIYAK